MEETNSAILLRRVVAAVFVWCKTCHCGTAWDTDPIIFTSMARCVREGKRMSMGIFQGRCKTFELLSLASFTLEPANSQQRTLRPIYSSRTWARLSRKRQKSHLTEGMTEETLTDLTVLVGKWDFPSLPVEAPTPSITTIQQLGLGIAHAFNSQTSPAFDHYDFLLPRDQLVGLLLEFTRCRNENNRHTNKKWWRVLST